MTDNEIIKALELCGNEEDENCAIRGCPLHSECKKDVHILEKSALDLINRQKEEIEQYKKVNILIAQQRDERDKNIAELEAEIERLENSLAISKKRNKKSFALC